MVPFHVYSTRIYLIEIAQAALVLMGNRRIPWWQRQVFRLARRIALHRQGLMSAPP